MIADQARRAKKDAVRLGVPRSVVIEALYGGWEQEALNVALDRGGEHAEEHPLVTEGYTEISTIAAAARLKLLLGKPPTEVPRRV